MKVPKHFLADAISTTCYLSRMPVLKFLDPRSLKSIFLEYSHQQKGYRSYSPDLGRYLISADVTFFESTPFSSVSHVFSAIDDDFLVDSVQTSAISPSHSSTVSSERACPRPLSSRLYSSGSANDYGTR